MTPSSPAARELLTIRATPGAPIACNMTDAPDTPQERFAEYGRLFAHALIGRKRDDQGVEFTFAAKPGVPEWIADLVRREAACCPFFSYQLRIEGDHLLWRTGTDAGAAAQSVLDEFHQLPDHSSGGLEGYFERLNGRGVAIISPSPGRFAVAADGPSSTPGLLARMKQKCGC
ncbi:MAG: hypothetical protein RL033_6181 [Pseudomonadota bacterium]